MNSSASARLKFVLGELLKIPETPDPPSKLKSGLAPEDYELLVKSNVISRVSTGDTATRPTMQFLVPFTVVETDENGDKRRRFISWTHSDNERLSEYEPRVPLWHPAKYLHRVDEEVGVKRDLASGFYQIAIE